MTFSLFHSEFTTYCLLEIFSCLWSGFESKLLIIISFGFHTILITVNNILCLTLLAIYQASSSI